MRRIATRGALEGLLAEDSPYGDLTTESLGLRGKMGEMTFAARDPMVLALVEDAAELLELAGARTELHALSGSAISAGDAILTARGSAEALILGWKTAQTLIEIWSGVATATCELVKAARQISPRVVVACTRKATPGSRAFAIAAIKAGGASPHRLGLSETILVFPEHLAFLNGESLSEVAGRLARLAPEKKLVIEVTNLAEAVEAAEAGFHVIQAEKFTPEMIAALVDKVSHLPSRPVLAAAGGINIRNAAAYAAAGADVLVTSAPYLAPPRDVQVRLAPTA